MIYTIEIYVRESKDNTATAVQSSTIETISRNKKTTPIEELNAVVEFFKNQVKVLLLAAMGD